MPTTQDRRTNKANSRPTSRPRSGRGSSDTVAVRVDKLTPNPANKAIFEDFEPFGRDRWFADSVAEHGVREALDVTPDGLIIDGHRRYYAALHHRIATVPCRILPNEDEARIAFDTSQLARNKTAYAKVRLYFDQIAALVDRGIEKKKANLRGAGPVDEDDADSEWEDLERILAVSRSMLTKMVRLVRQIDSMDDPEAAEKIRSTLRNHGYRPAMRLLGEKDAAESDDAPDLSTWERHNDPKTRPKKARAEKPRGLDLEEPTISFDVAESTAATWHEQVSAHCLAIEELFGERGAFNESVGQALNTIRLESHKVPERKAAA